MRVHGHCRLVVNHRHHHVGRFAAYAGQPLQFLDGARHLAAKLGHEQLAQARQVLGLIVGVGNAADERENVVCAGRAQLGGGWKLRQQRGHHLVHTLVGALGAQHHGHYQLVRIAVGQLGFRLRKVGGEVIEKAAKPFGARHAKKSAQLGLRANLPWNKGYAETENRRAELAAASCSPRQASSPSDYRQDAAASSA